MNKRRTKCRDIQPLRHRDRDPYSDDRRNERDIYNDQRAAEIDEFGDGNETFLDAVPERKRLSGQHLSAQHDLGVKVKRYIYKQGNQTQKQYNEPLPGGKEELPVTRCQRDSAAAFQQSLKDPSQHKDPDCHQDLGRDLVIENIRQRL